MSIKPPKLLSGNPLQTPAGKLVVKATDASLVKENWDLVKLVCDFINVNDSAPKDAYKAIKKRLHKNRNFHQVNLTLSLLEVCVKKCDNRFRKYIMTEKFCFDVLLAVIAPKYNPDIMITQRILGLIQEWAYVFDADHSLVGVKATHQKLLQSGCFFPPPKKVSIVSGSQKNARHFQNLPTKLTPDQIAKLQKDLSLVNSNTRILSEMLIDLNPLTCYSEEFLLMREINKTCLAMHGRAFELFSLVNDQGLQAGLLTAIDDLNNVLLRYDRFEKFREAKNLDYVFPESISSASSLRSISTGAENIYVETSPSHLSTTSSILTNQEDVITLDHQDSNVYSLASDVDELSLQCKLPSSSAPVTSFSLSNGHSIHAAADQNSQLSNGKLKHTIGTYVQQQALHSWDEIG